MDYSKLTKKELIEECKENNLNFSSNMTKIELETLLINNKTNEDSQNIITDDQELNTYNDTTQVKAGNPPDGVGKAGAIINIIVGVLSII